MQNSIFVEWPHETLVSARFYLECESVGDSPMRKSEMFGDRFRRKSDVKMGF